MSEKNVVKRAFERVAPSDELIGKTLALKNRGFSDSYIYGEVAAPKAPRRGGSRTAVVGGVLAAAAVAAALPFALKSYKGAAAVSEVQSEEPAEDESMGAGAYISPIPDGKGDSAVFPTVLKSRNIRTVSSAEDERLLPNTEWATSPEELRAYYEKNKLKYGLSEANAGDIFSFEELMGRYGEEFFKEHNLVIVTAPAVDKNVKRRVNYADVKMSDGSDEYSYLLTFSLDKDEMADGTGTTSQEHILVEVDNIYTPENTLAGVSTLTHQQDKYYRYITRTPKLADVAETVGHEAFRSGNWCFSNDVFINWGEPSEYYTDMHLAKWYYGDKEIAVSFSGLHFYSYSISDVVVSDAPAREEKDGIPALEDAVLKSGAEVTEALKGRPIKDAAAAWGTANIAGSEPDCLKWHYGDGVIFVRFDGDGVITGAEVGEYDLNELVDGWRQELLEKVTWVVDKYVENNGTLRELNEVLNDGEPFESTFRIDAFLYEDNERVYDYPSVISWSEMKTWLPLRGEKPRKLVVSYTLIDGRDEEFTFDIPPIES